MDDMFDFVKVGSRGTSVGMTFTDPHLGQLVVTTPEGMLLVRILGELALIRKALTEPNPEVAK